MEARLSLAAMKGQVLRFTGVVDRFGSFESVDGKVMTVCIRDLKLFKRNRKVTPDHWWFRWRQEWAELYIKAGDEVCFTSKVKRQRKGMQPHQGNVVAFQKNPLRTAFGPGHEVRDLTVIKRKKFLAPATAAVDKLKARLEQSEILKNQHIAKVNELSQELQALKSELQSSQAEVEQLNRQSASSGEDERSALQTQLSVFQQTSYDLQAEVARLTQQLDFQRQQSAQDLESLEDDYQSRLHASQADFAMVTQRHQDLVKTVAHLQADIKQTIPRQRSLMMLSVSAGLSLMLGIGIGTGLSRSNSR